MRGWMFCVLAAFTACGPAPARAEVAALGEAGFVSRHEAMVAASPEAAFEATLRPADWWNPDHTYSSNASNLVMRGTAGGCFCEVIPGEDDGPGGEIEHMRVVYIAPYSTLRLTGALGPLQPEAVQGVLTMTFEPRGDGTRIVWDWLHARADDRSGAAGRPGHGRAARPSGSESGEGLTGPPLRQVLTPGSF